ncbi:MAG: DUF3800 domain-containing protein [Ignavibacteria bacterium]|nr:DUF3800 domain-containing protein [Ignavibacteria bacterium]
MKYDLHLYHRFLDEAGDTTFYGKGKNVILGDEGVSKAFILGIVKFKEPLDVVRSRIRILQQEVVNDPYFIDDTRIQKRIVKSGFYFHASNDRPEVRKIFFEYIKSVDCSAEVIVGRKILEIYNTKHRGVETEFYADLLSHILKSKLNLPKLVLNIAERGDSTKNRTLQFALHKAIERKTKSGKAIQSERSINFNVQNHIQEPLLNIADYICWAVQKVFEKGDIAAYNYIQEKISLVIDVYDSKNYENHQNFYRRGRKLTAENKISPLIH